MCEETHQSRKRVIDKISTVFQTFSTMVTNAWQEQLLIGPKVSESGIVEGPEEVPVGAYSQSSPPGTTAELSYNPQDLPPPPSGYTSAPHGLYVKGSTTFQNSIVKWESTVQMQEPVGDVSHSNGTGKDSSWHLNWPEIVSVVPSQVEKPRNSHSIR